MTPAELRDHIYKTYFLLRGGLSILAFVFTSLAIGNWPVEGHPASRLDERLLLRLRSTQLRIAGFPRACRIRWNSLCSGVFSNTVQRVFKDRKLGVEHSWSMRRPCRTVSNPDAGLLQQLRKQ